MTQIHISNNNNLPIDYYLFNNKLRERQELAVPPKEAYLYFPKNEEVVLFNPLKPDKILRRIFSGVTFTSYENEKYAELKNELSKRSIYLPQWWEESESHRFLQATDFDIDKAIVIIQKQIAWRTSYFPISISDHVVEILNTGFMYIHGRDIRYRPIFIIQAIKYSEISKSYTYDELFLTIIYFLEYIIHNLLIIGQVENWIMISDLTDVSVLFMPRDLKRLIDSLSSCYRCRLYKNFILGLSIGMRWVFKLCTSCIDEVTLQKISVLEYGKWDLIKQFIHEDNLEVKFGGKVKDIKIGKDNYFPPVMPCNYYNFPGENILISEFEYKERWYQNKLSSSSFLSLPLIIGHYYQDKWNKEEKEKLIFEERRKRKEKSIMNKKKIDLLGLKIKSELNKNDNYQTFTPGRMFLGLKNMIKFDIINNTSPLSNKKQDMHPPLINNKKTIDNYQEIQV